MAADLFSLPLNEKRLESAEQHFGKGDVFWELIAKENEMNLLDLLHLIAENDVEPDDPDSDMFLRRLHYQSVSFAADMIASATVSDRQITIETTTNRTYTYTY